MKKMVKNGLIAILVVLLALCLVSCGGNEPDSPIPDPGPGGNGSGASGGIDDIEWIPNTKVLSVDFNDGTCVTIHIASSQVAIGFTSGDGSTPVYDRAMFQSGTTAFDNPTVGTDNQDFYGDADYLPASAGNWTLDFTCSTDTTVIFSFTIPTEYTTYIRNAIDE